jgi:phage terminase large subunit GpA-like protein
MKILVNEKGQAQCPRCGKWNELEIERVDGLLHEFSCCSNWKVAIDEENLEKFMKGKIKKIPKPEPDWFVYKG